MHKGAHPPIEMPAIADLDALDEVREALLGQQATGEAIEFRLGGVERISTNALLMILCAANQADGAPITLSSPSAAFKDAVDVLGLSDQFAPLLKGTT
jgi:anti-anti-sigma regulatory factor